MTKDEFYISVARSVATDVSSDSEILALMWLLHTHCIKVANPSSISDSGNAPVLAALTRRGAAEAVAHVFGSDVVKRSDSFWNYEFTQLAQRYAFQKLDDDWKKLVLSMIDQLKHTGLIEDLFEEE